MGVWLSASYLLGPDCIPHSLGHPTTAAALHLGEQPSSIDRVRGGAGLHSALTLLAHLVVAVGLGMEGHPPYGFWG